MLDEFNNYNLTENNNEINDNFLIENISNQDSIFDNSIEHYRNNKKEEQIKNIIIEKQYIHEQIMANKEIEILKLRNKDT